MNKVLLFLTLVCAPTVAHEVRSSDRTPAAVKQDVVELHVQPEDLRDGLPNVFTVTLRNQANHEIRIPEPQKQCISALNGGLILNHTYTSPPPKNGVSGAGGCASGIDHYPPIAVRVKEWHLLQPGQILLYHVSTSSSKIDVSKAGSYEFWVAYWPPHLSDEESKMLALMKIEYPRVPVQSQYFAYEKH